MWKADLKNTLFSKRMLLVIFSVYAAAWTGCFESVRMGSRDITCLCEELLTLSSFKRLLPLFAGIGFALGFRDEYVYQYWYYAVLRTSKRRYISAKILTNLTGSFLAAAAGMVLFCMTLILWPDFYVGNGLQSSFERSYLKRIQENGYGGLILLSHIWNIGLYSSTCAMIALAVSGRARGKYAVILGPFLVIEGSNLLFQMGKVERYHPNFVLDWRNSAVQQAGAGLICLVIMVVCGGIFAWECARKMR